MDVTYHERDSQIKHHRDGCRHHNCGMNTLGERLKTCREAMKLKQGELAARAGLRNQSIIGMLEIGERKQSSHLPAIASALGVNVLWLQYGRGPMRGAEGHALNALERTVGHLANVEPGSPIRGEVPLISWVQAGAWAGICITFVIDRTHHMRDTCSTPQPTAAPPAKPPSGAISRGKTASADA